MDAKGDENGKMKLVTRYIQDKEDTTIMDADVTVSLEGTPDYVRSLDALIKKQLLEKGFEEADYGH